MVQTLNFINLSSQQAPNDVNWAGLVNSGVQGVLIRLGHGIIRDPCASGHIAKAKQYGLYWHGYHTYEGVVNEPQFTIKNATELGLSTSQYYFVDLTKSSDPFNDYYALHANWLSQGYSTGLLISNEDYLSKFTDSEVTASGSLRWLISDTEPANYDIWQYSSEGTIGTSSVKVGFNFAKTDKLKYNLSTALTGADINKDPYNPQAPVGGAYIGWGYDTTGLGGGKTFGYSTNGKNFYALVGPKGLVVRKSDGNRIYGTIADQIDSAISANVIPAKSAADSAVSAADAAVESAQVTSAAVSAVASATAEAKQGANEAMSRAKSAWDVATSATNAASSAQSGAKQATSSVAALSISVNTLKGNVTDLQAESTMQAGEIKNKVTRSDVTGMLTGYATQEYTQSLVTQKADDWNLNLTKLKNDTQTSVTNLSATVDGIKGLVETKADQSEFTQLSDLVQTKVSSGDFISTTTQLKNEINQRVQVGDVISQINQEAGGDTLIQVSNGKKSLVLDAGNTIFTGKAWIPDAAISSISADKVMLGSSALYNSDGTLNLVNQSNGLKALIQIKQGLVQDTTQSIISFSSDYNNRAFSVTPVGATITPTLFFERYDQTAGHWLGFTRNEVRRDGLMFHTWDDEGERFFVGCHARFDRNISATGNIYQGSWNGTTGKPLAGVLSIQSGNTIWSGSDFLAIGDHLSNSFTNVMARSFSQQSTLSSKTNIETVDPKDALDLVNRTDIRSYQYKTDVAEGKAKRYTSLIIDDVNDVSKYYAPDEFTNEERTGRDDGSAVGYLFLAIQELTRRIKTLEEKLNG